MAQNLIACDRDQPFLLPPDVREWLPEDHLAWFVIDAVGVMDTRGFYTAYRRDGHGRAAYEPSMMIALLLYGWARGARSARRIEHACLEDVACRVIAAHQRPDHATIARFVVRHERALGELFGEMLALCADAGLARADQARLGGDRVLGVLVRRRRRCDLLQADTGLASRDGALSVVAFFHMAGLDYVSCSPYRVPIARLAAAQAAIRLGPGQLAADSTAQRFASTQ